jgi:cytochrome c-type biogenesis protein CcmE
MTRKQRRLTLLGIAGVVLAAATGLILTALQDSIVFFRTPTEIAAGHVTPGTRLRLGGLVGQGSLQRGDNLTVRFAITDGGSTVPVAYTGLLPDLFREGQGVIVEGEIDASGAMRAETVLAKHDEAYMPREVADALKAQGVWKGEGAK